MNGLNVAINVRDAVEAVRSSFEDFGERALPRAVQFTLNRVVIEATNDFRRNEMPTVLRHMNAFIARGVRYELDKRRLDSVTSVDQVVSAAFIQPMQSTWLKYAFDGGARRGGDVGIEAWLPHQDNIYIPNAEGLADYGVRTTAGGSVRGMDAKRIAGAMARGYQGSGGARFGGAFEIRPGDADPARLGVGIHARPMRGLAVVHRERIRQDVRAGRKKAPRTQFTDAKGRQVDVPRVVNLARPELLFLSRPEGHYKPSLKPGWEWEMEKAADRMGDYLLEELADKWEHAAKRGRR